MRRPVAPFLAVVLSARPLAACAQDYVIGPNVRVSIDTTRVHLEVTATSDPNNASRLAACAIVRPPVPFHRGPPHTVLYVSGDGGASWRRAVEDPHIWTGPDTVAQRRSWDPSCTWGLDGSLYFATATTAAADGKYAERVRLHRSPDAGQTWLSPSEVAAGFFDKPWIVATGPDGNAQQGRIVLAFSARHRKLALVTSDDGGTTFTDPIHSVAHETGTAAPNSAGVLSDGSVVFGGTNFQSLYIIPPGARQIARVDYAGAPVGNQGSRNAGALPSVAVDPGSTAFRDRIYVTWSALDGARQNVFVIYSKDRGATWSRPRIVNDDIVGSATNSTPLHSAPTIAANSEGVVGVSWYDRRDHPDNVAYDIRFSASLDGGETWLPSTIVSDQPSDPRQMSLDTLLEAFARTGGHYSGLTATADGAFHPVWVDYRSPIGQLWTTSIWIVPTRQSDGA